MNHDIDIFEWHHDIDIELTSYFLYSPPPSQN